MTTHQTLITFPDGSRATLRGRRASLVAWLVNQGGFLDAAEYELARLEFNWGRGKLDTQATRFTSVKLQEGWGGEG